MQGQHESRQRVGGLHRSPLCMPLRPSCARLSPVALALTEVVGPTCQAGGSGWENEGINKSALSEVVGVGCILRPWRFVWRHLSSALVRQQRSGSRDVPDSGLPPPALASRSDSPQPPPAIHPRLPGVILPRRYASCTHLDRVPGRRLASA